MQSVSCFRPPRSAITVSVTACVTISGVMLIPRMTPHMAGVRILDDCGVDNGAPGFLKKTLVLKLDPKDADAIRNRAMAIARKNN
jgi:hypothetical protein